MSKEKRAGLRASLLSKLSPEEYNAMAQKGEVRADKLPYLLQGNAELGIIEAIVVAIVLVRIMRGEFDFAA